MSLNNLSRIALALGALTISALPAFADTAPVRPAQSQAVHATTGVKKTEAVKNTSKTHHVKKISARHHAKSAKSGIQQAKLSAKKPVAKAGPKL